MSKKDGSAGKRGGDGPAAFAGVDLAQVADRLRALAHPDRLRLVAMLLDEELPVGELARRAGLAQPVVSGHLRILQSRAMLACRRDGQHMYYRAATPALADICTCIRSHFSACQTGTPR